MQLDCILLHDLALVLLRHPRKRLRQHLLRPRPRRRLMWIVRRPHEIVRTPRQLIRLQPYRIINEGVVQLAPTVLTGLERQRRIIPMLPPAVVLIRPLHQVGHPGDVVLRRHNLQARKPLQPQRERLTHVSIGIDNLVQGHRFPPDLLTVRAPPRGYPASGDRQTLRTIASSAPTPLALPPDWSPPPDPCAS